MNALFGQLIKTVLTSGEGGKATAFMDKASPHLTGIPSGKVSGFASGTGIPSTVRKDMMPPVVSSSPVAVAPTPDSVTSKLGAQRKGARRRAGGGRTGTMLTNGDKLG